MPEIGDAATPAQREKPAPALKLNFLSHGTLESRDLTFSRRFYEEFLGLEVSTASPTVPTTSGTGFPSRSPPRSQ